MVKLPLFESHFDRNKIVIAGRFIFYDANFCNSLLHDIISHANSLEKEENLEIRFFIDYYCTWMRMQMVMFIDQLADIDRSAHKCSINVVWGYEFDDDDVFELGEILLERSALPIKFLNIENEMSTTLRTTE